MRPGDTITSDQIERLRDYLPEPFWEHRERFLPPGMRLEIGPCYRDYSPPHFFQDATQRFRGVTRLGADGTLEGYRAGLPFAPDSIDPKDARAGLRWAWNWVHRYHAAGHFGDLRLTVVDRQTIHGQVVGEHYWVVIEGRAERPDEDYRFEGAGVRAAWAGGGELENVGTGNSCAFRQYATGGRRPDLFFWDAGGRRVVRGMAPDSEGPLTGCVVDIPIGGGLFLHGYSPQLHEWRVVGVRDLLAPINTTSPGYPEVEERDFGPWGISFANDRWELRRAIVLEGRLREGRFEDGVTRFVWYLDLQTLFPLYYASYRDESTPGGIGHFVGRWSEDRPEYRPWPDDPDRPVRVLDEVGSALVDWNDQDAVRIETWNTVGTPPPDRRLRRMLSQSSLRGH